MRDPILNETRRSMLLEYGLLGSLVTTAALIAFASVL